MLGLPSPGSAKSRRWVRWKLKHLQLSVVSDIFLLNITKIC